MNKNIIEKAKKIIQESEHVKLPDLETFVHDTLTFFEELRDVFLNGSPEDKKEATALANQLQTQFEALAKKTYASMGLSQEQIKALLVPQNFSSQDWAKYQNIDKELTEYRLNHPTNHPTAGQLAQKSKARRPKNNKERI